MAAPPPQRRSPQQLREDALAIWRAAVDAVRSDRLVLGAVRIEGSQLYLADEQIDLRHVGKIAVVGAGKAGAGMAAGLQQAFANTGIDYTGWVNVPADCVRELDHIRLHPARPAGINEPTAAGVHGARQIINTVASLSQDDLCICLISGGGSALLPLPIAGVCLEDKLAVTQFLSGAGANIGELNTVRKQLSLIKGAGLGEACRAGRMITLIISDVIGDPLDLIASGPTVPDSSTPRQALEILDRYGARSEEPAAGRISPAVFEVLEKRAAEDPTSKWSTDLTRWSNEHDCRIVNVMLGNNAVAVDAAGVEAERRGYSHAMSAATELEGAAEEVGEKLAEMALRMRSQSGPDCLITGGEPTVKLADKSIRGRGGRNQQLVLAGLQRMMDLQDAIGQSSSDRDPLCEGIVLASGGTDGEDGPTDAAGAFVDAKIASAVQQQGLNVADYLARNDAYTFFEPLDGLIKTGPTHTNVCDVRVVVVDRVA